MELRFRSLTAVLVLVHAALPAEARVQTVFARNPAGKPAFEFRVLRSPSAEDRAAAAGISLASGAPDENGGALAVLTDGKVPASDDDPRANFFFAAGTDGGRIVIDLGGLSVIDEVYTYSWHTASRAPQVYKLYAGDPAAEGFEASPAADVDPAARGWSLLAQVDTRPERGEGGGQYAVGIFDSEGPVASCRYLLFDVAPTERRDPFGNTFFSEIDVFARDAAAVAAEAAARGIETIEMEGGYTITIDTSGTPDLSAWVHSDLAPVLREWYPRIVGLLPSEGFRAPESVRIVFSEEMRGVAATSGTRVGCAARWFRQNLDGEAKGAVVHELVHVVQQYGGRRGGGRGSRPPGWLVEGIPDYIRWFLYEPESRGAEIGARNLEAARHDASYRVSANFLDWVTRTHEKDLVRRLNAALRHGEYTDGIWKELTGHTVEDLAAEWKKALRAKLEKAAAGGEEAR